MRSMSPCSGARQPTNENIGSFLRLRGPLGLGIVDADQARASVCGGLQPTGCEPNPGSFALPW